MTNVTINPIELTENKLHLESEEYEKKELVSKVIQKERRLTLEVIEGEGISIGTIIQINAKGLIGSKRNSQDGHSYFGTEASDVFYFNF